MTASKRLSISYLILLMCICSTSYAESINQSQILLQPASSLQSPVVQQPETSQPPFTPQLSKEDFITINAINGRLKGITTAAFNIYIKDGNITVTGIVNDETTAISVIGNINATPGIQSINVDKLLLADGSTLSREVIATGLVQGNLLRSGLYGNKINTINKMPVKVSANNNIIYLDGTVDSLYISSRTIIIAQRLALKFSPPMRVISRMNIRGASYGR